MQTIQRSLMGELVPVSGPFATYFDENDGYDLALYISEDSPVWLVKVEIDYFSSVTDTLETVEKEFAVDAKYLEVHGRGKLINKMEELYDKVVLEQLPFVPTWYLGEIRNKIMDLMQEAFDRLDAGEVLQ